MQEAHRYLTEMEDRRINVQPYIDAAIVDEIYRGVGLQPSRKGGGGKGESKGDQGQSSYRDQPEPEEELDGDVDEDIAEVLYCTELSLYCTALSLYYTILYYTILY